MSKFSDEIKSNKKEIAKLMKLKKSNQQDKLKGKYVILASVTGGIEAVAHNQYDDFDGSEIPNGTGADPVDYGSKNLTYKFYVNGAKLALRKNEYQYHVISFELGSNGNDDTTNTDVHTYDYVFTKLGAKHFINKYHLTGIILPADKEYKKFGITD